MGTPLADQRLRRLSFTAGGTGLIPGQGTKVPLAGGETETEKTRCSKCDMNHII